MPLKYGLPLMSSMAILHWLVSQSVFVVQIVSYWSDGSQDINSSIAQDGYSPLGIMLCKSSLMNHHSQRLSWITNGGLSALILGLVMIIALALIGIRKFPDRTHLAFTSSAVISAACHQPLPEDGEAHKFPVQWGVVSQDDDERGVGHCSFTTARDVRPPEIGREYA